MAFQLRVGESYQTEAGKVANILSQEMAEGDTEELVLVYKGKVGTRIQEVFWTEDGSIWDGKEGDKLVKSLGKSKVQPKVEDIEPETRPNPAPVFNPPKGQSYILTGTLNIVKAHNGYIIHISGDTLVAESKDKVVGVISTFIAEKLKEPEDEDVVDVSGTVSVRA